MLKPCANCGKIFKSKGTTAVNCSSECANVRRRQLQLLGDTASTLQPPPVVKADTKPTPVVPEALVVNSYTLPPPEELPAPYAKRVYEMWLSLTGGRDAPTRIA
jgi:hypothetical protein